MSRIDGCPVDSGDIVLLDLLTQKADGVSRAKVEESVAALESCAAFFEPYYVYPDLERDSGAFLDQIYPMQQNSESIRRRFRNAISLLRSKLGAKESSGTE